MEGGDRLLLLLLGGLLALSALVHGMLGLLVERIGWRRLSRHVAGVQSNSLQRREEASREQRRRKRGEKRRRRRKGQTSCCEQLGFLFELVLVSVTQELLIFANKTNPLFMALIQLGYF